MYDVEKLSVMLPNAVRDVYMEHPDQGSSVRDPKSSSVPTRSKRRFTRLLEFNGPPAISDKQRSLSDGHPPCISVTHGALASNR